MSVSVDCAAQYHDAVRACLDQVDLVKRLVNKYEDDLELVDSYEGQLIIKSHFSRAPT